jgi:hypothetical protein
LLRRLRRKWVKRLECTGDESVVKDLAPELVRLLGATDRLIDFILAHKPDPPAVRPKVHQIDWSDESLRDILDKVYEHRSDALHEGIPFPEPMCSIPQPLPEGDARVEKPMGLAWITKGGVWSEEDFPMHLHVFEYIVRGRLLKWWKSFQRPAEPNAEPTTAG